VDDEVNPGVTGVVCGERPVDVARAIGELLRHRATAERIGNAAAADIRARLDFDAVLPRLEAVFVEAMETAGARAIAATSPVRWEQSLLNVNPDGAAVEFAASIGGYSKRLSPTMRAVFLDALAARLGSIAEMQGAAAITALPDAPALRR
jgi:hypothetical protein